MLKFCLFSFNFKLKNFILCLQIFILKELMKILSFQTEFFPVFNISRLSCLFSFGVNECIFFIVAIRLCPIGWWTMFWNPIKYLFEWTKNGWNQQKNGHKMKKTITVFKDKQKGMKPRMQWWWWWWRKMILNGTEYFSIVEKCWKL